MGLFPNPGQNVYLITPPFFESVSIRSPVTGTSPFSLPLPLPSTNNPTPPPNTPPLNSQPHAGKTATIRNANFDPSYGAIYIQSATLNGAHYTKNWLDHSFFTEGKELVLTLGRNESTWGTRVEDLPPSLSEYVGFGNGTVSNGTMGGERWRRRGGPRMGALESRDVGGFI